MMKCGEQWNVSVDRFDIGVPGKQPSSARRYREALDRLVRAGKTLEGGDLATAQMELREAEEAVKIADRAVGEDEQMHKDVEWELDEEMGSEPLFRCYWPKASPPLERNIHPNGRA